MDEWTACVKRFTDRHLRLFHQGRCDYPDSEPRFRIQALITCLQRDLGIRYRADRRSADAVFEPEDSFLHGILAGKGGTCASLPVVYASIGRRLGYPLQLASTRGHLFVRWDGSPSSETFNIEASGDGVSFFPDDHYRTGKYQMPAETIEACGYLQSLSPREELSSFLMERGECWLQEQDYQEAVTAFAWAYEVDCRRAQHAVACIQALQKWDEQLRSRLPQAGFPVLDIGRPCRKFVNLPLDAERQLIRMRIQQELLGRPEYEERWWRPLRRDSCQKPPGLPDRLRVDFSWDNCPSVLVLDT